MGLQQTTPRARRQELPDFGLLKLQCQWEVGKPWYNHIKPICDWRIWHADKHHESPLAWTATIYYDDIAVVSLDLKAWGNWGLYKFYLVGTSKYTVGCTRIHLHQVTKLAICPIGLLWFKINQKEFFTIFRFRQKNFGWFWTLGAQLDKWPTLSLDVGACILGHPNTCIQTWELYQFHFSFSPRGPMAQTHIEN